MMRRRTNRTIGVGPIVLATALCVALSPLGGSLQIKDHHPRGYADCRKSAGDEIAAGVCMLYTYGDRAPFSDSDPDTGLT